MDQQTAAAIQIGSDGAENLGMKMGRNKKKAPGGALVENCAVYLGSMAVGQSVHSYQHSMQAPEAE